MAQKYLITRIYGAGYAGSTGCQVWQRAIRWIIAGRDISADPGTRSSRWGRFNRCPIPRPICILNWGGRQSDLTRTQSITAVSTIRRALGRGRPPALPDPVHQVANQQAENSPDAELFLIANSENIAAAIGLV